MFNSGLLRCVMGHPGVLSPWSGRLSPVGANRTLSFSCCGKEGVGARADSSEQSQCGFQVLKELGCT